MNAGVLVLRLPEGVELTVPLAGPVRRLLALAVDMAAVAAASSLVSGLVAAVAALHFDLAAALATLLYFTLAVGYAIYCEIRLRGQTLGKRLMGLRVVDASGMRLRPVQVVLRNLLRPVDILPGGYLLGGLAMLASPLRQRLGDLAAGTVVVQTRSATALGERPWQAARFNSLAAFPHLVARLRQTLTPEEARLALEALLRRDELEPEPRLELFAALAAHLRERVPFPEEAWAHLADEQYVRNVADLLFRPALDA